MIPRYPVHFFIPNEPDIKVILNYDPDRDWKKMRRGQRWLLQTYLRLKGAGYPVSASGTITDSGFLIFHAKHSGLLKAQLDPIQHKNLVLISIRGDGKETTLADFEFLQNGKYADDRRFFHVPYWPQPGLIPRDPGRGTSLDTIGFKGFHVNLNPYFLGEDWREWLRERGIRWKLDSEEFNTLDDIGVEVDWHNYHDIDAILAYRAYPKRKGPEPGYTPKPATKLYNAWHAGVPAILGPDYAYRELRKTRLDYIEITSAEEAKDAVLYLRSNPEIYRAMVENGFNRAENFSVESITDRWVKLLFDVLPGMIESRKVFLPRWMPLSLRKSVRYMDRKIRRRRTW